MNIKNVWFYILCILVLMLVIIAILGIWELIDKENAWKSILSLFVMSFGVLLLLVVSQKIFK